MKLKPLVFQVDYIIMNKSFLINSPLASLLGIGGDFLVFLSFNTKFKAIFNPFN
jgi:hypothetical protein